MIGGMHRTSLTEFEQADKFAAAREHFLVQRNLAESSWAESSLQRAHQGRLTDTRRSQCPTKSEPELNLLLSSIELQQPLWKSLIDNLDDLFFPRKLSPLVLTSKPIPLKPIWGFYNYKNKGVLGSTALHVAALIAIVGLTMSGRGVVQPTQRIHATVTLVTTDDLSQGLASKMRSGGGGGDRDKLEASKGRLPRLATNQIVPPALVVRNENPKLAAEPTVAVPPQIFPQTNTLPNLGDPMSNARGPLSNGTGYGGGIGSGSGGGVGSGEGPGVGPGSGGGYGGGVFRVGGGVSPPRPTFAPDPDYSDEARRAAFQGTCVLWIVVGTDGRTRDIRVMRMLGFGLDQEAIEAVKQWRFEPATQNGRPVAVQVNVEVSFRLY